MQLLNLSINQKDEYKKSVSKSFKSVNLNHFCNDLNRCRFSCLSREVMFLREALM